MLDWISRLQGLGADRFDRGRTIGTREQPADGMHDAECRGARGKRKQQRVFGALRQTFQHANRIAGPVMDQRVHCDHVVETSQRRVEHVADVKVDLPPAQIVWQPLPSQGDQGGRKVDCHDMRTPAGGFHRQRACAATGIEDAGAVADPVGSQSSRVRRMSSRPARTVARMRFTGASEVRRFQASTAVRSKYCSNSPRRAA